jgi:diguanylate cyclase (GGDEF)-like protein
MESSVRILVVDDSPSVLEAITGMVDGQFELQKASSLAGAVDCAERVSYSIVLMGLALPDGEGSALIAKLRKLYAMRPLQIIAMSGSADHARVQKALSAGADDFIKKPFEELEFKLRVKAALMRLAEQKKLISEREFYRQAVHQEETLSAKLLDRQMNLKEDLAAMTEKRKGFDSDDKKLAAAARYDVLSGLLSRQSLASRIELEARRASEESSHLSGLMIDLDRFKSINDSYGNLSGDEAIRAAGDAIRSCLRREDYAGRYGGEEFFVLLPGAELSVALAIAERIREFIATTPVKHDGKTFNVAASVGVAEYRRGEAPGEWVARSDSAMYRAKQLGRNRVEA